jgi:hypothetical protein
MMKENTEWGAVFPARKGPEIFEQGTADRAN